jgi:hypothetical protein
MPCFVKKLRLTKPAAELEITLLRLIMFVSFSSFFFECLVGIKHFTATVRVNLVYSFVLSVNST